MNKTLAQLKRDLQVGTKLKVLDHIRQDQIGIVKTITKKQSNGIYTNTETDPREFWLEIPSASLVEYNDDVFSFYLDKDRKLITMQILKGEN